MKDHIDWDLTAYLRDELDSEKKRRVSDHLIDCPQCRREFQLHKRLEQELNFIPQLKVSKSFSRDVMKMAKEMTLAETKADFVFAEVMEMASQKRQHTFPWVLVGGLFVVLGLVLISPSFRESKSLSTDEVLSLAHHAPIDQKIMISEEEYTLSKHDEIQPLHDIVKPEKLTPDDMRHLAFEYELVTKEFDEMLIPTFADHATQNQLAILPDQDLIRSQSFISPQQEIQKNNIDLMVKDQSLKLSKPLSENDFLKQYHPQQHWVVSVIDPEGLVGTGDYFSMAFNALMASQISVNIPHLFPRDKTKMMLDALGDLPLENGMSRSLYHHALFTYHLARLVSLGHHQLRGQLRKACDHLVDRQNQDGGWGFFHVPKPTASNTLVTGWATLALSDASRLGIKKLEGSQTKARQFFHRLTDPRSAECGFFVRGDHREPHLCSTFSLLVRLTRVSPKRIPQTIKRTQQWIDSGLSHQRLHVDRWVDYDFLMMTKRFFEQTQSSHLWPKKLGTLTEDLEQLSGPSRWGHLSQMSTELLKELIFNTE